MGLLSSADATAIELYCTAYSRYGKAAEHVQKYGDVILSPNKKYPMLSPWATAMNQAWEQCRKAADQIRTDAGCAVEDASATAAEANWQVVGAAVTCGMRSRVRRAPALASSLRR
jgi:phage terminase small subunit